MDGGTPTKDPPKRGSLFAARAVSEAVAVVPQAASHGEPTTTDGERRPLPGAGNQQVARPRTVARAGSRAQGRFRAVAARPGARIVGRFFIRTPPPAQGCPGHANRPSVRPVVFFGLRQKTGVGLVSGVSFGRGVSYFFHSASLRKKNTGLFAPLMQGPRQSRPSLAGPVTGLAASPSDK